MTDDISIHPTAAASHCTYIVPLDLLLADLLQKVIDLILRQDRVVGEDHLVQRAVINNDFGDVASNISEVRQGKRSVAITDDFVVRCSHGIVGSSGTEAGVRKLVPPTDVDDGVRKSELFDVVVHCLFLEKKSADDQRRYGVRLQRRPRLTSSLNHMIPPGGATVMNPHGMNRWTPALFAALASGIWSCCSAGPTQLTTTSIPVKTSARDSSGPLRSPLRICMPRSCRATMAGF